MMYAHTVVLQASGQYSRNGSPNCPEIRTAESNSGGVDNIQKIIPRLK